MKPEKGIEGGGAHLDGMVKEAMFERDLRAVSLRVYLGRLFQAKEQ